MHAPPVRLASNARLLVAAFMSSLFPVAAVWAEERHPCVIVSNSAFLLPQLPDPGNAFGRAVAVDGDWIAVGVPAISGTSPARVELFHRTNGSWLPAGFVVPSDGDAAKYFARCLDLQGDTLVVGASLADGVAPESGAVFVFRLVDGAWTEEAKLVAPVNIGADQSGDAFGADVAVDGHRVLVGARHDTLGGTSNGAAYLFLRTDQGWELEATLKPQGWTSYGLFGDCVALAGGTAAVAAPYEKVDGANLRGAVRIFEHGPSGWTQSAKLAPHAGTPKHVTMFFGKNMSLRGDVLLASSQPSTGTALVFTRTTGESGSTWAPPQRVLSRGHFDDYGGGNLALGADGDVAVKLCRVDLPEGSLAAAGIFRRDHAGWHLEQHVLPPQKMGFKWNSPSVVSCDGRTLVAGQSLGSAPPGSGGKIFVATVPPIDRNANGLADECELAEGLTEDCNADGLPDDMQLPSIYAWDRGPTLPSATPGYHIHLGHSFLLVNRFATTAGQETLRSIGFANPIPPGEPSFAQIQTVVFLDPDGDGHPWDAVLIHLEDTVLPAAEVDAYLDLAIEPVYVGPEGTSFFAGVAVSTSPNQPLVRTATRLLHRQVSWAAIMPAGPLDVPAMANTSFFALETMNGQVMDSEWHTFRIRVNGADCTGSGRLDQCEIAEALVPDLNADGIPDACQSLALDFNGDGAVDALDLGLLLLAWGLCPDCPSTPCLGDVDGDCAVNGVDLGALLAAWDAK